MMDLLLSLQPFQAPVAPPQVLLPLSSLQPFQAVTPRLLIRQFHLQQLQFRRIVQLRASVPLSFQGVSSLFMTFLMDLRSRTINKSGVHTATLEFSSPFYCGDQIWI